jgi:serine/threonine-protein kinase RsbW
VNKKSEQKAIVRMLDERTVEVSLPNKVGYERIAMECSASFARIVGFVKERVEDLKTAVSEACLNAIEHGNKGRPDARVIIVMNYKDGAFSVSVMDEGDGIKEPPKKFDIEERIEGLEPPRGLGMHLIKQLVDQVEFDKIGSQGHVVKMVIRIAN